MELNPKIIALLDRELPWQEVKFYNGIQLADVQDQIEDNMYRHALESMALALQCSMVSEDIIEDAVQTALDAYGNNC